MKPFKPLVAFHRGESSGAIAASLALGVAAFFAARWVHNMFPVRPMQVQIGLTAILIAFWAAWFAYAIITVVFWVRFKSRSHVLPKALGWFIVSMALLGIASHVSQALIPVVAFMTFVAFSFYLGSVWRLSETEESYQTEKAMKPFQSTAVSTEPVRGTDEQLIPQRK